GSGALAAVTEYAAGDLGWDARCKLFEALSGIWLGGKRRGEAEIEIPAKEEKREWKMPDHLASKVMKLVKIIK
ncbi:MAG: hypothetical protein LBU26_04310, partial [Synergistaceae bacterium]|nr:hypothetical protein [Synergistaceae bacterium]